MDLSELNDQQKESVEAGLGPVLVLAGAGSGKTRVLTYRIAYIVEKGWFKGNEILAVTFTNKAAAEMKGRIEGLLRGMNLGVASDGLPTLGTFHSIGARILRREIGLLGYTNAFNILDSDDSLRIFKDIVKELEIDERYSPSFIRSEVSKAKNRLETPENIRLDFPAEIQKVIRDCYARYQNILHNQNLVDFDDLLMLPVKIFEVSSSALERYQNKFKYILVDEYQDTNYAQYVFLKMLCTKNNIFVVGDDAQSIYGFRGSSVRNILDFEKDFKDARVFKLEQNYRSTKHILAVAQEVIDLNKEQKSKVLWTENEAGELVKVKEAENEKAEAFFVVKKIIEIANGRESEFVEEELVEEKPFSILDHFIKKQGVSSLSTDLSSLPRLSMHRRSLSDFAILFRTHAQSRVLEEVLVKAGVPYKIVGGLKFYERKEIKDLLAYLRFVVNPKEVLSFKRIINIPPRGLGEKSTDGILQVFSNLDSFDISEILNNLSLVKLSTKQRTQAEGFFRDIDFLRNTDAQVGLPEFLRLVIKRTGFESYLRDKTQQGEERYENVKELISVASKFGDSGWRDGLVVFLEEVALVTDSEEVELSDSVTLMTLHSAKGLEFDVVFFVGLEEGILPHSRSLLDEKELSEEIRLAYVGLTRARQKLFLVYARTRVLYGDARTSLPSRILKVLPPGSVQYSNGNLGAYSDELIYEEIE